MGNDASMRLSALIAIVTVAFATPVYCSQTSGMGQLPFQPIIGGAGSPNLFAALTRESRASIFFDYARDTGDVLKRLNGAGGPTTVLVPTNGAILALQHKPHQGPPQAAAAESLSALDREKNAQAYLERWVELHTIAEDEALVSGRKVTFVHDVPSGELQITRAWHGWTINPGAIAVADVVDASNGKLIFIEGTLSL